MQAHDCFLAKLKYKKPISKTHNETLKVSVVIMQRIKTCPASLIMPNSSVTNEE